MHSLSRFGFGWKAIPQLALLLACGLLLVTASHADDKPAVDPVPAGQRSFTCGHSFHAFTPPMLSAMAKAAGIKDHETVGLSSIGGSRVIQHWDVPEEKNKAKEALAAGKVDVLTLSPIHLPDEGIEKFAELALKHNPRVRITVQEFWLPYDIYDPTFKERPKTVDHNAPTAAELRKLHDPYFKGMDDHVRELEQEARQAGAVRRAGRTGGDRPAREDHRGRSARAEVAGRPVHRRHRPSPPRRCRCLRRTAISPSSTGTARSACRCRPFWRTGEEPETGTRS